MFLLSLFAEGGKTASSLLDKPDFIYASVGLAGALLFGAVAVYAVDRWRKRATIAAHGESGSELTSFRTMYERGEITDEEYARLRQKVATRVKSPAPTPSNQANAGNPGPVAGLIPPAPGALGPAITGPLPADYFDDPETPRNLPSPPAAEKPPGQSPPSS